MRWIIKLPRSERGTGPSPELAQKLHLLSVLVILIRSEATFGQVLDWVESHVHSQEAG